MKRYYNDHIKAFLRIQIHFYVQPHFLPLSVAGQLQGLEKDVNIAVCITRVVVWRNFYTVLLGKRQKNIDFLLVLQRTHSVKYLVLLSHRKSTLSGLQQRPDLPQKGFRLYLHLRPIIFRNWNRNHLESIYGYSVAL